METRLVWHAVEAALCPYEGVVAWRRDAVVQAGGFSTLAADPDLDMMVRLQTTAAPGIDGGVVRSTEIFGHVNPRPLPVHRQLTARRQRATLQTVWSCRPRGAAGRRMIGHFALTEIVTPFAQVWALAAMVVGAVAGWFTWGEVLLLVALLSFGRAVVSVAALLLRGAAAGAPDETALGRLLLASPFDFAVAGTTSIVGRGAGVVAFLRQAWTPGTTP
jgi:hypothetical protein